MVVYMNGSIFGIRIYQRYDTSFDFLNKKYETIMNDDQLREAYLCYKELVNKDNIFFHIYTECSSTYDKGVFMAWFPIELDYFLEKFGGSFPNKCEKV